MGMVWLIECVLYVCMRALKKGNFGETSCEDGQRNWHSLLVVATEQRTHYLLIFTFFISTGL